MGRAWGEHPGPGTEESRHEEGVDDARRRVAGAVPGLRLDGPLSPVASPIRRKGRILVPRLREGGRQYQIHNRFKLVVF